MGRAKELTQILDDAYQCGVRVELADEAIAITGPDCESWREKLEPYADEIKRMLNGEPLDDSEIPPPTPEQKIATAKLSQPESRTEVSNAERFVDAYHRELLFVPPWGKWLSWDGQRWHDDSGTGAKQRAKRYARRLWDGLARAAMEVDGRELAKVQSFVRSSNTRGGIESFLSLASVDELNDDPNLLNVANGTLDLTTGELRPHNPADRITQLAPVNYDPDATCPKWLETLDLVFDGDPELIAYVQRLLGYSISGDTGEHVLPIACGNGNNGKSTVWGTVVELLGDYAQLASEDLLMGERSSHPTDKASLYQLRFVPISEPEKGAALREARCKELTGDRRITARRMREDYWSFDRTHTFWLSTNHLPRIDGTDEGIWRRVKLIPFTVDLRNKVTPIPDFDRWLVDNEGPGILGWLVRGFLAYREHGLREPEAVREATRGYREESDPLGEFVEQCCVLGDRLTAPASELIKVYQEEFKGSWGRTRFGKEMAERFGKSKVKSGPHRDKIVYHGVGISSEHPDEGFDEKPPKTRNFSTMGPVGTSSPVPPTENGKSIGGTAKPVPLSPIGAMTCQKCGSEMVAAEPVGGWRNWDCPSCGHVQPAKVEGMNQ